LKMPNKILRSYYPGFQRLFQALLLNFFVPMLSGLFNWARKPIHLQPSNLLFNRPGGDPWPVLLDFCPPMSGTKTSWLGQPWNTSLGPLRLKPAPFFFFWSMILWLKKQGKRSPGADGTRIMPTNWPMSLVINGFFRPCYIKISSSPFGPSCIIPRALKDVDGFRPKWPWSKNSCVNFISLYPAKFISWPIPGIGLRIWRKPVAKRGII